MINKWEISAKSILYQLHKPERAIIYIEQHNLDSVAHRSRQPVNRSISQNKLLQEKRNLARVLTDERKKKESWITEPVDAATWRVPPFCLSSEGPLGPGLVTDGKEEEVAAAAAVARGFLHIYHYNEGD